MDRLRPWFSRIARARIAWHAIGLGAISAPVLYIHRDALFWHLDGFRLLQLIEDASRWSRFSPSIGLDPYRGPGNLFLPMNYRLFPVFFVQDLWRSGYAGRVVTYILYGCQNMLLLWLLARRLRLPATVGIVAGWLMALLVTPLIWTDRTTLLFSLFLFTPPWFDFFTFSVLFFITFIEIGRIGELGSTLLTVACLALLLWFVAAGPILVVFVAPFVAVVVVITTLLGDPRERRWKPAAAAAMMAGLWICGALEYVLGFLKATPATFFGPEIETYQSGLYWSAIAYQYSRYPAAAVLVTASTVVAFALVSRTWSDGARRHVKSAAVMNLVCVAGILSGWTILDRVGFWPEKLRHLRLVYFELPLLPFYVLFAAMPIAAAAGWVHRRLPVRAALIGEVAIPVAIGLATLAAARDRSGSNPYRQPVKATRITDYLRARIGLVGPGDYFRGRAATIFPADAARPGVSWDAMIAHDIRLYGKIRNDLRFVGLWAFGIPTLQEYTQIINPGTYFWVTRGLSVATDTQDMRNHAIITHANVPLLEMFGVRYVISPEAIDSGSKSLRLVLRDGDANLYELPDANVGQYAAAAAIRVHDAPEIARRLRSIDDLLNTPFVFEDIPGELSPGRVTIRIERDAIRVQGTSDGRSLVVLPFTYSTCYRISNAADSAKVQAIRVNLNMLGLVFERRVDATLQLSVGLLNRSNCLLNDANRDEQLGLAEAGRIIPRGGLAVASDDGTRAAVK